MRAQCAVPFPSVRNLRCALEKAQFASFLAKFSNLNSPGCRAMAEPVSSPSMRRVAYAKYLLPSPSGKKQPHVSNWRMSSDEAAALGAISIVPGTTEWREIPETEAEKRRAQFAYQSAGMDGAQPPKG